MIEVVFLLLVFFMLASQFGHDKALTLSAGSGGTAYTGPPRLIGIGPDTLRLNGVAVSLEDLATRLGPLMQSPDDIIILRGDADATLQRLIDVAQSLKTAGFTHLSVVE
ncbi:biopolymer transporter ExbD [Sulfitobacter sp. M57]|uniref:ExbD/TolR family protein n=1 Tax=unclassified Sulfitobacter TaxID=196795 RepID=UPI002A2FB268|nr:biopolymer transporter ExbD [Sulfitobacter sp. KE5]MDF3422016.1 biopolymer transporter ExbD [Sulfitobacter sp. KE43]MDF3433081.1 biopolymer transporter ExbD [Sulfitobacter sp. KE42]MDF3458721.1 biopolymer transporter ExbD [Sulfitobacter sp. S74]MDF3462621.1 biopolymer transporter ExbD [Sulfitobacter sp. Ks18]MDF3466521.1 biopolymer transporter ExbD [Sulfitobacter sp. M05]MDF3470416.1 biopolymer transporter ExbD [Sulfitobacter sp. M28]MDF3474164.1 biopolymer transporter ExbD [Sulfitobacter